MKVSEIYPSIQGEGPRVGVPTTFVRFGGCNLRCPGWGEGKLPDGTVVQGCDTIFAVYPQFRKQWIEYDPFSVVDEACNHDPMNICLTGGEPLIQKDIDECALEFLKLHFSIDLFTNGSQYIGSPGRGWVGNENVSVVMDYKLPSSGEFGSFEIMNIGLLQQKDAIKFVCGDRNDFNVAVDFITEFVPIVGPQVYFGVVWDALDAGLLIDWMQDSIVAGWAKLNIQTHKYIWDPEERKV